MGIITLPVASFANGLVQGEIGLDDSTLRVRVARVINNSDYPAFIEVFKTGVSAASMIIPAHSTQSKNLPANIKFAMDAGDPAWGIPPEMCMADIVISCGWPWS